MKKNLGLIIVLIVFWIIFETIVKGKEVVKAEYGINPELFVWIFVVCEVMFNLGIMIMVIGAGKRIFELKWRDVWNFDIEKLNSLFFEKKVFWLGFGLNRLAALVPCGYLLLIGGIKLPEGLFILCCLEIVIVLTIGSIPVLVKRSFQLGGYRDGR